MEPTKQDYEKARETWAARVINIEAELRAAQAGYDYCAQKAKEMPDEDPMPEPAKEILDAVK